MNGARRPKLDADDIGNRSRRRRCQILDEDILAVWIENLRRLDSERADGGVFRVRIDERIFVRLIGVRVEIFVRVAKFRNARTLMLRTLWLLWSGTRLFVRALRSLLIGSRAALIVSAAALLIIRRTRTSALLVIRRTRTSLLIVRALRALLITLTWRTASTLIVRALLIGSLIGRAWIVGALIARLLLLLLRPRLLRWSLLLRWPRL